MVSRKIIYLLLPVASIAALILIYKISIKDNFNANTLGSQNLISIRNILFEFPYKLGLSVKPKEVMIGKNDWLYSIDILKETISINKEEFKRNQIGEAENINNLANEWVTYLARKGVKNTTVLLIPSKHTLYPEYLPSWAAIDSRYTVKNVLTSPNNNIFIDSYSKLNSEKNFQEKFFYNKTDNGLNLIGSAIAFQAYITHLKKSKIRLNFMSDQDYSFIADESKYQGELPKKIYLPFSINETKYHVRFKNSELIRKFARSDTGSSLSDIDFIQNNIFSSILITTEKALNQDKVLWIYDDSSIELMPFISALFENVLAVKWYDNYLLGKGFPALVDQWKPEFILFSINEGLIRKNKFEHFPPSEMFETNKLFQKNYVNEILRLHHLKPIGTDKYKITGKDPYIVFNVDKSMLQKNKALFFGDLKCLNGNVNINSSLQLFWHEYNSDFSEAKSVTEVLKKEGNLIELGLMPQWSSLPSIQNIRVDINSQNCNNFHLKHIILGTAN